MRVDAYATQPHYLDHVMPVVAALPAGVRGVLWCSEDLAGTARSRGIVNRRGAPRRLAEADYVIVGGLRDLRGLGAEQRPVLIEHGVGQTYTGDPDCPAALRGYPGGAGAERVSLFLVPNERCAGLWRAAYPAAEVRVVGCPKLDRFALHELRTSKPRNEDPVVAVSFHWNCRLAPEAGTTAHEYLAAVRQLAAAGVRLIGHGHPRILDQLRRWYRRMDVPVVDRFADVLEQADLYVCDNSSTLYEFAATGRPVLCLNGSRYRKDVEHGLRFWSHVPGLQCDEPAELQASVELALADPPEAQELRHRAVNYAYCCCADGQAAGRAAQAIIEQEPRP